MVDTAMTRRAVTFGTAGAALAGPIARADDTSPAPSNSQPQRPDLIPVTLRITGQTHDLKLDPRASLLDTLREQVGLTGTKKGCDRGSCGACTVHVDGRRMVSCLTLAARMQGKDITTIEGISNNGHLHPVQVAFMDHDGFQCGYCTPGQIMSAVALIKEGHHHSDDEIREWMSGNICRCGAYPNIVDAIRQAVKEV
jgi:xanthine dehydrogenase YagT iron-sulfur-binding subunit